MSVSGLEAWQAGTTCTFSPVECPWSSIMGIYDPLSSGPGLRFTHTLTWEKELTKQRRLQSHLENAMLFKKAVFEVPWDVLEVPTQG